MCNLAYLEPIILRHLKVFVEVDTEKKKNTNRWKNRVSTIKFELGVKLVRLALEFFFYPYLIFESNKVDAPLVYKRGIESGTL